MVGVNKRILLQIKHGADSEEFAPKFFDIDIRTAMFSPVRYLIPNRSRADDGSSVLFPMFRSESLSPDGMSDRADDPTEA